MSRRLGARFSRADDDEEFVGITLKPMTTLWDGTRGGFVSIGFGARYFMVYIMSWR